MFEFLKRKKQSVFGIDINESAVHLVALNQRGSRILLEGFALVDLPEKSLIDGQIEKISEVAEAINKGVRLCGTTTQRAVTAIPASNILTKEIQILSAFEGIELEEQVRIEAEQFLSYSPDEVAIDFEVMEPVKGQPEFNRVKIVASRREFVSTREDVLDLAGLKCEIIDVDTYLMERLIPSSQETATAHIGLIEFGRQMCSFYVIYQGEVVYFREQGFSSQALVEELMSLTSLSKVEVIEQLSQAHTFSSEAETVMSEFVQSAALQVSRAVQFYNASGSQEPITQLYLTGCLCVLPNITHVINQQIEVPVEKFNPFESITLSPHINLERFEAHRSSLIKALGSALRGLESTYDIY